jgi:Ras-related protein Rab-6A
MEYSNDDFTYTTNDGLKVIFVGESSTGKTALINCLMNKSFQTDIVSTSVPVESRITMKIDNKENELTLSLWDTAGQEKFRCLNKLFFKEAKIAIIVCDITKKKSFDEIHSFWYNYIKEVCGQDIVIAIAENKADLYDMEEVFENDVNEFAKQFRVIHKRTSAKTGAGIRELLKMTCEKYVQLVDEGQIFIHRRTTFSVKNRSGSQLDKTKIGKKRCCDKS